MKILYLGSNWGTSRHRFEALKRLGHDAALVDPYAPLRISPLLSSWSYKTGAMGLAGVVGRHVLTAIGEGRFDVVWVDNGELVGARLARELKRRTPVLLNYNLDNPFTARDGRRWRLFHAALPEYDIFVTPRISSRDSALGQGARHALCVGFSADEVVHRRCEPGPGANLLPPLDVVFVGTWMPERGPFLARLLECGVPLQIFGACWMKAPEYPRLRAITTPTFQGDEAYVGTISRAKIALCMLSSGNEDLHTTRSLEIPAIGTLLCAPRTIDHMSLYRDTIEACFFDDADECASLCLSLLTDSERRNSIAMAGMARARQNRRFNEDVLSTILFEALGR